MMKMLMGSKSCAYPVTTTVSVVNLRMNQPRRQMAYPVSLLQVDRSTTFLEWENFHHCSC